MSPNIDLNIDFKSEKIKKVQELLADPNKKFIKLKYLRTNTGQKFANSKRRLLEFVFFSSVLCCVSKNVDGIDEQKICDQNSSTEHDDFAEATELDQILPFQRYIGVSPQVRVYKVDFDSPNTWVPVELESWTLNDHRAYLEGGFTETFTTLLSMVLSDK